MEGERRRRQILHRQARELVYKVFSYFKREENAGMQGHGVAKAQERTAEACDISIKSVQRIISEGNVAICMSLSLSLSLRVLVCRFT
jgi:ABC-type proline/glycine betaine transport system ATPase subunit